MLFNTGVQTLSYWPISLLYFRLIKVNVQSRIEFLTENNFVSQKILLNATKRKSRKSTFLCEMPLNWLFSWIKCLFTHWFIMGIFFFDLNFNFKMKLRKTYRKRERENCAEMLFNINMVKWMALWYK